MSASSASDTPPPHVWSLHLPTLAATSALARDLAPLLGPGDLVTLGGDLGAGKTAFARELIRRLSGDAALEVPSPTFTLMQVYEAPGFPIVHADLYRIAGPDDLDEIGWDEAAADALVLVEWPERAGHILAKDRLDIHFTLHHAEPGARHAVVTGHGRFARRLARVAAVGSFLRATGWDDAAREHIQGDASTRSYERLTRGRETAVLMNAPPRTDTVPVRYGRPYSAIAHISQDVKPFVAMARGLADRGFSAPEILSRDLDAGLLLLEDFGSEGVVEAGEPIAERYGVAIDALAALHGQLLPAALPVGPGVEHVIPPFDLPAMDIEVELLLEWYLPYLGAPQLSQRNRDGFSALWRPLFNEVRKGPETWLLRDVHSPNLIWLSGRRGIERIGLLDFQDAMIGPPAYDVAALCLDARVTVPEALELQLLARYVKARLASDGAFDTAAFARDYAIMGAQRLTKILGIFARLARRDGKPGYLRHLPRIRAYLDRTLAHPALADLRGWYETFVFSAEAPQDAPV